MGKKKSGGPKDANGFQTVSGKKKEEPKPEPSKDLPPDDPSVGKKGKSKWHDDTGFTTVAGRPKKDDAKTKKAKAAAAAANAPEISRRIVPLNKDQVMPIRQKKKEVEEDSNARLTHKDSPFPGKPSTVICEGTEMAVMRAENMLLKMLREVKHEEAVPLSKYGDPMIGVVIGPGGQTLQKIEELAPKAKIQLPEEGGKYVSVFGTQSDVQKIAAALRRLTGAQVDASQVEIAAEEIEVVRKVPKDDRGRPMHWVLIGKGGCNARRIREETGAELIVPPPQSYSDEYSLRGSLEATEKAARIIFELLSEIGENPDMQEQSQASSGPSGGSVVAPKTTSNAKTCVAPRLQRMQQGYQGHAPSAPKPAAAATPLQQAPAKPLEVVNMGELTLIDIPLPQNARAAKAKQQIKDIAQENNVKITFDGNNSFRLDGYEQRCLFAERAIFRHIGMVKAEVPIPKSRNGDPMVGVVIGPQGKTIEQLRIQCGNAFVHMPDDGCGFAYDQITIFGSPAEVEHAVDVVRTTLKISEEARMTAKAADPNIMEEEVEVPMDRYGKPMLSYLIGTKGKNIQWIRDESNGCEIDIPKGREQGVAAKCKLRGTEAQIKAAREAIHILFDSVDEQSYVSEPQDHTLPPNPYEGCVVIGGR